MIVHIQGSYGTLTVDSLSGEILTRNGEREGETAYPDISRFDASTLTDSHMDILECGYWDKDGAYEPPDAEFLAGLKKSDNDNFPQ